MAEQPVAEQPVAEQPFAEQPFAEQPVSRHRVVGGLGPVRVAAIVAGVLVVLGIGAVVIPALLSGGAASRPPPAGAAAPVATSAVPTESPTPNATPTTGVSSSVRPGRMPKVNVGRFENTVIELVNEVRRRAGCDKVRNDGHLHDVARRHSMDMAATNTMSHTGSDGSSPQQRMRDGGYRNPLAENLAVGYQTPQDVMNGWMNSPAHRQNILNCRAKAIGVGLAYSPDATPYWTQDFGG